MHWWNHIPGYLSRNNKRRRNNINHIKNTLKEAIDKLIDKIWLFNLVTLVSPQFACKSFEKSIKYQEKQNGLLRQ